MKTLINFVAIVLYAFSIAAQNITVDNTATPGSNGNYNWTVFIKTDAATLNSIDRVEYLLNPTFANPQVSSNNKATNFGYSAKGGGEFQIKAKVIFKDSRRQPALITYWIRLQARVVQQRRVVVRNNKTWHDLKYLLQNAMKDPQWYAVQVSDTTMVTMADS
ncbi:MAG: hypothetical protein H7211_02305 [Aquabacterium sp.]|nr:hypothetical protein [Ferruginibacter sp.]